MGSPESSGLPEWIRWAVGILVGVFSTAAMAVASWVGMRRDLTDTKGATDRHAAELGSQGRRIGRLERFESSTVEKLDNLCERVDEHREEFRTFAAEVRTLLSSNHRSGGRHG